MNDEHHPERYRGPARAGEPDVEVLLAEVVGGDTLRLFIDHPDGVTLALCERVTHAAGRGCASATRWRSPRPGSERPLTKPRPLPPLPRPPRARAHARARTTAAARFTGELVGASDDEVTIAADSGVVADPVRRHPPFAT